jgi:hypothetical protein
MDIAIIIFLFALLLLILVLRSERKRGKYIYDTATDYEENNDYEAACYYYALAMNAGYDKVLCQNKIRELWQTYGPFDFQKQHQEAKTEYRGESTHFLTVSDIHNIANKMS